MENKPIKKINSIAELVMMMGKSTSDDEKRQLKEQIDKIRAQRASKPKSISKMTSMKLEKATDDATTAEPTLAEKTMMLRKYYAEKYGQKPVVNNTSKILDLIDDSSDLKPSPKNEWFSPTDGKSILQQLDDDYEIIEIKINMRKKYKLPTAFCRP